MTVSLKMPGDLASRLDAAARRRGISKSALVRDALEAWLDRTDAPEGSAGRLANDLIGSLKGPRDLSENPEHLKGLGR